MNRSYPARILLPLLAFSLAAAACFGLQACSIAASDLIASADRRPLLLSLRDMILIPRAERFAARAAALEASTGALASAPSADALDSAKAAWQAAATAWAELSALRFGPTLDQFARIGFWPTRPNLIEQALAAAYPLDSARFAGLTGSAAKGMPALEWLLFALPADSLIALLSEGAKGTRRGEYLRGTAGDVRLAAGLVVSAWKGRDGFALASPASGTRFPTTQMAVEELIKGLVSSLEEMKNAKVLTPAGAKTEGRPQPDAVESPYAGWSLETLRAGLDGAEAAFTGQGPKGTGMGLNAYMSKLGSGIPVRVESGFASVRANLAAVPPPLGEAVVGQPAKVAALGRSMTDLVVTIKNDVASTLGVNITFTDNDGD